MYQLSNKSLNNLKGVHPDLVKVVKRALELSQTDFSVIEGVRTTERQAQLVAEKRSQTMNSKHLVQSSGYGHAVDLVPYPVNWKLFSFHPIAEAMRKASKELNIRVRWGGAWIDLTRTDKPVNELIEDYSKARRKVGNKVFIDAPHFELV